MRKFWFAYLAKALVVFPGGFGTLDELTEILTLVQTRKLHKEMVVLLYGTEFWKEVVNFEALVRYGMVGGEDLNLFQYADDVDSAFEMLREGLTKCYLSPDHPEQMPRDDESPAIAHSRIAPG
jgi:predicted Rossmann-fold nucleotide-binding protein